MGLLTNENRRICLLLLTEIKILERNVNPHKLPMRVVVVIGEAFLVRDKECLSLSLVMNNCLALLLYLSQ